MNRLLVVLALFVGATARPRDSDAPLGVIQAPARDLKTPTSMKQHGKKLMAAALRIMAMTMRPTQISRIFVICPLLREPSSGRGVGAGAGVPSA